jgi:hypothetical protein
MGLPRVAGLVAVWVSALALATYVFVSFAGGWGDDLAKFALEVSRASALLAIAAVLADGSARRS